MSGGRPAPAGPGLGQPGQGGGDRRRAVGCARRGAACPAQPTCPTWSRTARPCSTTPGSRRVALVAATGLGRRGRRHRPGGRRPRGRARRLLGPLCRRGRRPTPTTWPSCCAELAALPDGGGARRARFRTVALAAFPDGTEVWAEGAVEGTILTTAVGASGGFGYDPVFVPSEGDGRTFAEMRPTEKHAISHRGRAFRALAGGAGGKPSDQPGAAAPGRSCPRRRRPPTTGAVSRGSAPMAAPSARTVVRGVEDPCRCPRRSP